MSLFLFKKLHRHETINKIKNEADLTNNYNKPNLLVLLRQRGKLKIKALSDFFQITKPGSGRNIKTDRPIDFSLITCKLSWTQYN